jgi:hypothetical protein
METKGKDTRVREELNLETTGSKIIKQASVQINT